MKTNVETSNIVQASVTVAQKFPVILHRHVTCVISNAEHNCIKETAHCSAYLTNSKCNVKHFSRQFVIVPGWKSGLVRWSLKQSQKSRAGVSSRSQRQNRKFKFFLSNAAVKFGCNFDTIQIRKDHRRDGGTLSHWPRP